MYCNQCYRKMIKNPSILSFYIQGRKMNIKNFPFYICPFCANIAGRRKDMEKAAGYFNQKSEISIIDEFTN